MEQAMQRVREQVMQPELEQVIQQGMEREIIEGTLDRIETVRKKDGVIGKVVIVWTVRDFAKITRLLQMQNAVVKVVVRVTIEDLQQELYHEAMDQCQSELDFDEENEYSESGKNPLSPDQPDAGQEEDEVVESREVIDEE